MPDQKSIIAKIEEAILKSTKPKYMYSLDEINKFLEKKLKKDAKPPKSIFKSMDFNGMESQIILTAPLAGEAYMLIHSVLAAFIISIIMYGEFKKGIKFSLPLSAASFGIFYLITTFGGNLFMGGF